MMDFGKQTSTVPSRASDKTGSTAVAQGGLSKMLCVTNRAVCTGDFGDRIGHIVEMHPAGILLREKDMDEEAYGKLAAQLYPLCRQGGTPLIVHSHPEVAVRLGCGRLHMPLAMLEKMPDSERACFVELSTSCHSVDEARRAVELGCTCIVAGHIFKTDCKPGITPRGIVFLHQICDAVDIPVWAIGGIDPARIRAVCEAGAAGGCMMSVFMCTNDLVGLSDHIVG
jgi:thiamine-phosphate diphosphorylase